MDRRQFIGVTASIGFSTAIAGCSGGSGDDSDGGGTLPGGNDESDGDDSSDNESSPDVEFDPEAPPQLMLQELTVLTPNPTYDEPVEFEYSIGNTGGEAIDGDATIRAVQLTGNTQETYELTVKSANLMSGVAVTDTTTVTFQEADEFRLQPSEDFESVNESVAETFRVGTKQVSVDDMFETPDNLRLKNFEETYFPWLAHGETSDDLFDSGRKTEFRETVTGQAIITIWFDIENASVDERTIQLDDFELLGGDLIDPLSTSYLSGTNIPKVQGKSIDPGGSIRGRLFGIVDVPEVDDVRLGMHYNDAGGAPEVSFPTEQEPFEPTFEIVSTDIPSNLPYDGQLGWEIKNTSEYASLPTFALEEEFLEDEFGLGTSVGDVDRVGPDNIVHYPMSAGESNWFHYNVDWDDTDRKVRLLPFDQEWEMTS
jgi:hypothetical protein